MIFTKILSDIKNVVSYNIGDSMVLEIFGSERHFFENISNLWSTQVLYLLMA